MTGNHPGGTIQTWLGVLAHSPFRLCRLRSDSCKLRVPPAEFYDDHHSLERLPCRRTVQMDCVRSRSQEALQARFETLLFLAGTLAHTREDCVGQIILDGASASRFSFEKQNWNWILLRRCGLQEVSPTVVADVEGWIAHVGTTWLVANPNCRTACCWRSRLDDKWLATVPVVPKCQQSGYSGFRCPSAWWVHH